MTQPLIQNSYTITFPEDFLPNLIASLGKEEAFKRAFEMGCQAFADTLKENINNYPLT